MLTIYCLFVFDLIGFIFSVYAIYSVDKLKKEKKKLYKHTYFNILLEISLVFISIFQFLILIYIEHLIFKN